MKKILFLILLLITMVNLDVSGQKTFNAFLQAEGGMGRSSLTRLDYDGKVCATGEFNVIGNIKDCILPFVGYKYVGLGAGEEMTDYHGIQCGVQFNILRFNNSSCYAFVSNSVYFGWTGSNSFKKSMTFYKPGVGIGKGFITLSVSYLFSESPVYSSSFNQENYGKAKYTAFEFSIGARFSLTNWSFE